MSDEKLIEVIAEASLDGRRSAPIGPARRVRAVAAAVEREFVLIPRAECEDVSADLFVPVDLVEDAAAWESYQHSMVADATTEAMRQGLLIISRPTMTEISPPGHYAHITGSKQFRLRALGWRLPDQDEIAPSGEHAPGPHHPAADGGPGAPS